MAKKTRKAKKEFDKDQMYKKIMPSVVPQNPDEKAVDLSLPVEELSGDGLFLHNYIEDMLMDRLEHCLAMLGCCDCERCRMDIMALALNQLPPAYAVAVPLDDRLKRKLRSAYEVKATATLVNAIQQVKQHPRHPKENA